MIRSSLYIRRKIKEKDYLLPFGQAIVDRRHPIQINDTVAFLWELLSNERTMDELTELAARNYGMTDEEDKKTLRADIETCIERLIKDGAVTETNLTDQKGMLIDAGDLKVYETPVAFHLEFPLFEEYKTADYIKKDLEKEFDLEAIVRAPREEFLASRWFYALKSLEQKRIFLHSVSILYKGELWLFSAPSGTGKSTHAEMWLADGETKIVNGDVNLLGFEGDILYAYGTPWCGTSGIYELNKYPVGGIVFLKRASYDHVEEMTEEEKRIALLSRTVSPIWKKEMLDSILTVAEQIADKTKICRLFCTKNDSAYLTMKEYVDCQKRSEEKD